jgi:tRNA-uridine 2-sulfurtransferase
MKAKRVVVAMSGGVDSSVTAALLKDKGFEVIGLTMQLMERSLDWGGCCGLSNIEDAKRVAHSLKIPHYVLNFRDIFQKKVIADFCREYQRGRTPNPCIRCNKYIKFDRLLDKAKQLEADYLATGHYARIEFDNRTKKYILRKGIDARKDQSYVLYAMKQKQLKNTLMPLGGMTKQEVRKIARDKKLPVADKAESQEICFIPDNDYGNFISRYSRKKIQPGPIINKNGQVIGKHKGVIFYTIGQRKGLRIAAKNPLYVVAIDPKSNIIMAGEKEDVYKDELIAEKINFINSSKLKMPKRLQVKIRYLHQAAWAMVSPLDDNKVKVKFDHPQWAVTPGQAAVFYLPSNKGDKVVGGGTINAVNKGIKK